MLMDQFEEKGSNPLKSGAVKHITAEILSTSHKGSQGKGKIEAKQEKNVNLVMNTLNT